MSCQRTGRKEMSSKFERENMEMKQSQPLTKAIHNAGIVLYMNILAIITISSKMKSNRFKIPHYA